MIDTIPGDATILAVRSVPRVAGRRDGYVDFAPGDLFVWVDGYDPSDPSNEEYDCIVAALSTEARDVFECEAWQFEHTLSIFPEDMDPVDDELDAVIRAAVALHGEMPIDTEALLSGLSNQPVIG